MKTLLIFIDGFGIGSNHPDKNPLVTAQTPIFDQLLQGKDCITIPTDASQGVPGIPQSATGQTALLTGLPASQVMGRHVSGFPGPTLRKLIADKNILKQLLQRGKKATFANAYTADYVRDFYSGRMKGSVTTVCVQTAGLKFRLTDQLLQGDAVYQDFTNQRLISAGYDLPLLEAEEAASNLVGIVNKHDFTLYEFFITDFAGHSQEMDFAQTVLENLDRFIGQVLQEIDLSKTLVVISSDHGNIEDLSIVQHTKNPVPTILIGHRKEELEGKIHTLTDITPAILSLYPE